MCVYVLVFYVGGRYVSGLLVLDVVGMRMGMRGRVVRRVGVVGLHAALVHALLVAHVAHSAHHAHHCWVGLDGVVLYGVDGRRVGDVWQRQQRLVEHALALAGAVRVRPALLRVRVAAVVGPLVTHVVVMLVLVVVGVLIAILVASTALESGAQQRSLRVALALRQRRLVGLLVLVVGGRTLVQRDARHVLRQLARRVVAGRRRRRRRSPVRRPEAVHAQVVVVAERCYIIHGQISAISLHALEDVRVDAGRRRRRQVRRVRRGGRRRPHHALHAAHVAAAVARAHATNRVHRVGIGGERVGSSGSRSPHRGRRSDPVRYHVAATTSLGMMVVIGRTAIRLSMCELVGRSARARPAVHH